MLSSLKMIILTKRQQQLLFISKIHESKGNFENIIVHLFFMQSEVSNIHLWNMSFSFVVPFLLSVLSNTIALTHEHARNLSQLSKKFCFSYTVNSLYSGQP